MPKLQYFEERLGFIEPPALNGHTRFVTFGAACAGVARELSAGGDRTVAVLPSWGAAPEALSLDGVELRQVRLARTMKGRPMHLAPAELARLSRELLAASRGAEWALISGSLPPGAPQELYALLTKRLRDAGVRVAVKADWETLCTLIGRRPDLIVLGERELERALGFPVCEPWDALAAIARLRGFGATNALALLGDGAVLADGAGAYYAQVVEATAHDRDVLLAGFLAAGAAGPQALSDALARASSTGAQVELTWIDALEVAR